MQKNISIIGILLTILLLTGCATIYNPLTGKKELLYQGLDTNWEKEIGEKVSLDVEKQFSIISDIELNEKLESIGEKIASVSDRRDLKYTFKIINNKEINAFTIFGGHIYVFKGALDKISSDDELASLLAHEIGHVAARHLAKQLQSSMGYSVLSEISLRLLYKDKAPSAEIKQAMDAAYQVVALGYSRKDEIEADRLGVRYTKLAGYDPNGMIMLLNRIDEESKSLPLTSRLIQNITIIRSHPQIPERIKAVKKEIESLASTP